MWVFLVIVVLDLIEAEKLRSFLSVCIVLLHLPCLSLTPLVFLVAVFCLVPNTYLLPFFSYCLWSSHLETLVPWICSQPSGLLVCNQSTFGSSCRGKPMVLPVEGCTPRGHVPTPCLVGRHELDLLIFSWPHSVCSQTRSPISIVSIVLSSS